MSLTTGEKLGPYEILAPIGAGGMGEVYRARDMRLGRIVAIKKSHARFSERFAREAHAIAALNHPHICSLYDVGPDFLVMEYVEGKPVHGPLPLNEALALAAQILDALDAAHRKGITHRDLKPGNILVSKAGIKVLDFGLAKIDRSSPLDGVTETKPLTDDGAILGTLQYMSPEQIEGQEADARSDIFAFGLVFYEMLTGKRAFEGKSKASLIASILKEQPRPVHDLQPLTPPALDRVLQTCLEKDPDKRWQSAREVKHALEWMKLEAPAPVPARKPRLWQGIAAACALIAAVAMAWTLWPTRPPAATSLRFQIPLPDKSIGNYRVALSRDGHKLAFTTGGTEGGLWVRDLDSLESRLLPGTQEAIEPSWSPDNRFLAFAVGNQLKKVDVSGGLPQTLCTVPDRIGVSDWNRDSVILFGTFGGGPLRQVPAAGGVATPVTVVDLPSEGLGHSQPSFLPDGRHFVYLRRSDSPEVRGIFVGSLDIKPEAQSRVRILATDFGAVYAASPSAAGGRLFFLRDGRLMAQSFDASRVQLAGEPVPIAEQVGSVGPKGYFSVSSTGALAYFAGDTLNRQLTWFDRPGKVLGQAGDPAVHNDVGLSPDGTRVASARQGDNSDIWLLEFARGVSTRLTFDPAADLAPVWSPDGNRIAFLRARSTGTGSGYANLSSGDLYQKLSSGAGDEELLLKSDELKVPTSWSHDGRFLLYQSANPKTRNDLWALPLEGDRKPLLWLRTEFNEEQGRFSPDRHWIAYASDESGRYEIYVRPFTPPVSGATEAAGGKWQVSRDGGQQPRWRADGKELFFFSRDRKVTAVEVTTTPAFQVGVSKALFTLPNNAGGWDVTADGKRFLVAMPAQQQQSGTPPITVVLNWEAGLKK